MAKVLDDQQLEVLANTTTTDEVVEEETVATNNDEAAAFFDTTPQFSDFAAAPEEAAKKVRVRGKKYVEAKSQVDRTIAYPAAQAVELIKATSYSKFDGTLIVHINLKKELKPFDLTFPYTTGQSVRVAIADDALLAQLNDGIIDFDVLLTKPDMMSKLAKYARVLGPKGLMPNPKNGTVTSDPEAKKASLMGGAVSIKPERKAPLMHIRIGKLSQPTEELTANLLALMASVNTQTLKVTIAATMSPGVKVALVNG